MSTRQTICLALFLLSIPNVARRLTMDCSPCMPDEKQGLFLGNAFAVNASIVTCITDQNSCIKMESGKIVAHTKASF